MVFFPVLRKTDFFMRSFENGNKRIIWMQKDIGRSANTGLHPHR